MAEYVWLVTEAHWEEDEGRVVVAACTSDEAARALLSEHCCKIHGGGPPKSYVDTPEGAEARKVRDETLAAGPAANPDAYRDADVVFIGKCSDYNERAWAGWRSRHCEVHDIERHRFDEWSG